RVEIDPKAAAKHLSADGLRVLAAVRARLGALANWEAPAIHVALEAMAQELGAGLGKVAQPVRGAVTGTPASPPADASPPLLGRERTLERLDAALERSTAA